MLAGVCGGIAAYTGIDTTVVRVAVAVLAVFGGAGIWAYVLAWLIIPGQRDAHSHAEHLLGHFRRNR